jgi:hypothetical protein
MKKKSHIRKVGDAMENFQKRTFSKKFSNCKIVNIIIIIIIIVITFSTKALKCVISIRIFFFNLYLQNEKITNFQKKIFSLINPWNLFLKIHQSYYYYYTILVLKCI